MPSPFNYGNRMLDGQFENHPCLGELERTIERRVQPLRWWYIHKFGRACFKVTQLPKQVAETYAVNPGFYKRMFCHTCGGYYDLKEFIWWHDSKNLDLTVENTPTESEKKGDNKWVR